MLQLGLEIIEIKCINDYVIISKDLPINGVVTSELNSAV